MDTRVNCLYLCTVDIAYCVDLWQLDLSYSIVVKGPGMSRGGNAVKCLHKNKINKEIINNKKQKSKSRVLKAKRNCSSSLGQKTKMNTMKICNKDWFLWPVI